MYYNPIVRFFHAGGLQEAEYSEIAGLLRLGGVIAFPTDTVYGLGVRPFNDAAIRRIFHIKGRTETKPILLIVSSVAMAESVSRPGRLFYDVAREFWPGPLTLVVPAAESLSTALTAGTGTVGVRWPAAAFATGLTERLGEPITATSANRSGLPSAATAEEVRAQLGESIDALVDGGRLPERGGSTLLDLTADPPVLLREGPVSFSRLHEFLNGRLRRHVA